LQLVVLDIKYIFAFQCFLTISCNSISISVSISIVFRYLCGFYLSDDGAKIAKEWNTAKDGSNLNDALVSKGYNNKDLSPLAAVKLKFVRGVGQDAIVEAFNDAFKGLDADAIASFKAATKKVIGEKGMKEGEEFSFFWFGESNGLVVSKNGVPIEAVPNTPKVKELEKRLLGVYLNNTNTVSPELVKSITENA
jgi:hypothetical protein